MKGEKNSQPRKPNPPDIESTEILDTKCGYWIGKPEKGIDWRITKRSVEERTFLVPNYEDCANLTKELTEWRSAMDRWGDRDEDGE